MKVVVVSGIWPPDVGGPASHAPEVVEFLRGRGHAVEAVITADAPPAPTPYPLHWVARSLPRGARHARALALIARVASRADVAYTTGMFGRSSLAATLVRTPYVAKLTADAAYERARRLGLFRGSLADFQSDRGAATLPLRLERTSAARRAAHVVCPSSFLAELVVGWGVPEERVTVLPNPAPPVPELPPREEMQARLGLPRPLFVFAGRLTAQKSLGLALRAVAAIEGATLLVVGDGPDRDELERTARDLGLAERARFLGAQPRERVLEHFRAADAAVLSSSWENFPHTVVEALAVGAPVVATAVGGVPEAVEDGVNGLLVPPGDERAFEAALRRVADDDALRARLAAAAAPSVEQFAPERVYGRLEQLLREAAA